MMNSTGKKKLTVNVPKIKISNTESAIKFDGPPEMDPNMSDIFIPNKQNNRFSYSPMPPPYPQCDKSPNVSPILEFTTPSEISNYKDQTEHEQKSTKRHERKMTDSPSNSFLNENLSIKSILKSINMEKYLGLFKKEEIDFKVFLTMNENDLRQIGIKDEMEQQIILGSVAELNGEF